MTLPAVLFIAAAVALAAASVFILTVRRDPAVRGLLEKLPRERISGTVLTVIALLWCIPNIRPIFMPDSPFQTFVVPLILLAIVLAAIFLNYLFARAAAAILILGWGLSIMGVNVTTIVASVGIVALIIGFGAESLIEDVITGFFMLFENQYNVGDIVEVGGFRGTVSDIGIRTTSITDPGGNVKIINNSNMKDILNRSDHTSRSVADIQIPYETDLPAFEAKLPAILEDIYSRHQDTMRKAPQYLGVQELGESGVTLRFIAEVEESDIYTVQRILNRDLFVAFRKAGVEVPYPQLDLHQK